LTSPALDITEDLLVLHLAVLRALIDRRVEVVAHLHPSETSGILLDELVIDILVDVDTGTSVASLAEVHVDAPGGPLNSLVEIGIGENNVLR